MNTKIILTVALDKLDIDPANVRKTELEPNAHMLASLAERGQIEPLIVRGNSKAGHYLVTNGGKRLRALRQLAKEGKIESDHAVWVMVREDDDAAARDVSLTTAVVREELHPVDEYEAFAALKLTVDEIAKRYGMKPKAVEQVLALGGLAPEIRKAWREDKLDDAAAQAFTLERDLAAQVKLFKQLTKSGNCQAFTIKRHIVGDRGADKAMLTLIGGSDAYEKAGGKIERDLFGDNHIVSDMALLKKLASAAIMAKAKTFTDAGWGWADALAPYGELRSDARWTWGPFGDAKMKPHKDKGVIIAFDRDGKMELHYGAMKPELRKKAEAAKAKKASASEPDAKAKPAGLSQALVLRLSEQMTKATAEALQVVDSKIAVAALVAAFDCAEYRSPLKVSDKGMGSVDEKMDRRMKSDFPGKFAVASKLKEPALMKALALVAGRAVDVRIRAHGEDVSKFAKPLLDALGNALVVQARKTFDAADYFESVSKAFLLKAIAEAVSPAEAKKLAGKPRAEVAKFAAANVTKTGWLPPELRNGAYKLTKR